MRAFVTGPEIYFSHVSLACGIERVGPSMGVPKIARVFYEDFSGSQTSVVVDLYRHLVEVPPQALIEHPKWIGREHLKWEWLFYLGVGSWDNEWEWVETHQDVDLTTLLEDDLDLTAELTQ